MIEFMGDAREHLAHRRMQGPRRLARRASCFMAGGPSRERRKGRKFLRRTQRSSARRLCGGNGLRGRRLGRGEKSLARASRDRPELDATAVLAPEAAAGEADAFVAEEALGEAGVARADVGEAVHRPRPAEELAFEAIAPRAAPQQAVDEKLHEMDAIGLARRAARPRRFLSRQQEMIHAADARDRIAQARGDAGAKQRRQHHIGIVADIIFALDDMNAPFAAHRILGRRNRL